MRRIFATLALLALAIPVQGTAQTVGSTAEIYLSGVGAGTVATWDNVYVGAYDGILTSDPTNPSLSIYCVDFAHSVSLGDRWTVNVSGIGDGADLSNTRLGTTGDPTGSLIRYRQAAYLASLFEANPSREATSGIHAAIWRIMTDNFPNGFVSETSANLALSTSQYWYEQAQMQAAGGFADVNLSEWRILSDVAGDGPVGGRQEFITRVSVPEPVSWALMVSGLLLIGLVGRRRLLGSEHAEG